MYNNLGYNIPDIWAARRDANERPAEMSVWANERLGEMSVQNEQKERLGEMSMRNGRLADMSIREMSVWAK